MNNEDAGARRGDRLHKPHHTLCGRGIIHARSDVAEGAGTHVARVTGAGTGGPATPGHPVASSGMALRKRFLVVVVGVPGTPAESQRSEVGRFRTLGSAENAGGDEWRRILFVHAAHVERYRVVVENDGTEVAEIPMPELPAETAPGILDETVTPLGASMGALGEPINPEPEPEPVAAARAEPEKASEPEPEPETAPEATGELKVIADEPETDDLAATGEHKGLVDEVASTGEVPAIAKVDDPPTGEAPASASIVIGDTPDGPVPEDIIQRFAEMVQAEEERAAERSARERGDGG